MVIQKKTLEQLNAESIEYLTSSTVITALEPGSAARGLVEAGNRQIADFYDLLETASGQVFISLATGAYLDLIGQLLGVSRVQEATATVLADDRLLRFYVEDGHLGTYLPHPTDSNQGQVPAGTTVTSRDGTVVYQVTDNFNFPVAAKEAFVSAQANTTGGDGNVGRWELNTHNLGVSEVLVRNNESITTGTAVEEDDSYRVRIMNQVLAVQGANETAVRLATLAVPGVADVRLFPGWAGAGSFRALLIPRGNRVPLQTLERVRQALTNIAAYGIRVLVDEPDYVAISLTVNVEFDGDLIAAEPITQEVEGNLRNYIGDIRPGGRLTMNRIRTAALNTSPNILDVSVVELCVDHRPMLVQDYLLDDDQVFIPDPEVNDPIRII
jgi:uncharacterized phage protein gp47/JayE